MCPGHRLPAGAYRDNMEVSGERLPRLRRSSLRTETLSDFSAGLSVSPGLVGPGCQPGPGIHAKPEVKDVPGAPAASRCLLLQPREVSGDRLANPGRHGNFSSPG